VLKQGTTVEELAGRVHKDFLEKFKSARVWGSGVFDGQPVGRDYVLQDGDITDLTGMDGPCIMSGKYPQGVYTNSQGRRYDVTASNRQSDSRE
jgi:hypothetical protein